MTPDQFRLVGQEVTSILVATNSIRLQLVRYPLLASGRFADAALIEIERGFKLTLEHRAVVISADSGLVQFRMGAAHLLGLIELEVVSASYIDSSDLVLKFDNGSILQINKGSLGFEGFQLNLQSQ